jgi:hypothetical protein
VDKLGEVDDEELVSDEEALKDDQKFIEAKKAKK